jgi:hypothetical protein
MALNGVGDIILTAVVRGLDGLISYWKSSTDGRSVVWIGIQRHLGPPPPLLTLRRCSGCTSLGKSVVGWDESAQLGRS